MVFLNFVQHGKEDLLKDHINPPKKEQEPHIERLAQTDITITDTTDIEIPMGRNIDIKGIVVIHTGIQENGKTTTKV